MEEHKVVYIKFPSERSDYYTSLMNKYTAQLLNDQPFIVNTPEKEQEIMKDIQIILDEDMGIGTKLFMLNYLSGIIDEGNWCAR